MYIESVREIPQRPFKYQSTNSSPKKMRTEKPIKNLHQLKIEAQSLHQFSKGQYKIVTQLLDKLKRSDTEQQENIKNNISLLQQQKDIENTAKFNLHKENCRSFIEQGFFPQVKKFYSTYKNIYKQVDKRKQFVKRKEQKDKQSSKRISLALNIQQQNVLPRTFCIKQGKNLKINQSDMHYTRNQLKTFSKGLKYVNLKQLNLKDNKIDNNNAKLLFRNVSPNLQSIKLRKTFLNKKSLQQFNCQNIKNCRLKIVDLSNNKISDGSLKSVQALLISNCYIEQLILSQNLLTDNSASILNQVVVTNSNLKVLNLSWNNFSGRKVKAFIQGICNSISLLQVNLSWNNLGNSQQLVQGICQILKKNQYIAHMDLSNNKFTADQCETIAHFFNLFNQTIRGLHFQGNHTFKLNYLGFLQKNYTFLAQNRQSYIHTYNSQCIDSDHRQINQPRISFKDCSKNQYFYQKGICNSFKKTQVKDHKFWKALNKIPRNKIIQNNCGTDQCVCCDKWVQKTFQYEKRYKSDQQNIWIHLSCYNFVPLRMKTMKVKNFRECFGNKHNSNDIQFGLQLINSCMKLSSQIMRNKQLNHDQQEQSFLYTVNLPIPSGKITYFFTVNNQITFNKSQKIVTLDKNIFVSCYNPITKALKFYTSVAGQNYKIQNFVREFSIFLSKANVYQSISQQLRIDNLSPQIFEMLTQNKQLTNEDYVALQNAKNSNLAESQNELQSSMNLKDNPSRKKEIFISKESICIAKQFFSQFKQDLSRQDNLQQAFSLKLTILNEQYKVKSKFLSNNLYLNVLKNHQSFQNYLWQNNFKKIFFDQLQKSKKESDQLMMTLNISEQCLFYYHKLQKVQFDSQNTNLKDESQSLKKSIDQTQSKKANQRQDQLNCAKQFLNKSIRFRYDFNLNEQQVLKFVYEAIEKQFKKNKSKQKAQKQGKSKFQLKVNKFCSLDMNISSQNSNILLENNKFQSRNASGIAYNSPPFQKCTLKIKQPNIQNLQKQIDAFIIFKEIFSNEFYESPANQSIDKYQFILDSKEQQQKQIYKSGSALLKVKRVTSIKRRIQQHKNERFQKQKIIGFEINTQKSIRKTVPIIKVTQLNVIQYLKSIRNFKFIKQVKEGVLRIKYLLQGVYNGFSELSGDKVFENSVSSYLSFLMHYCQFQSLFSKQGNNQLASKLLTNKFYYLFEGILLYIVCKGCQLRSFFAFYRECILSDNKNKDQWNKYVKEKIQALIPEIVKQLNSINSRFNSIKLKEQSFQQNYSKTNSLQGQSQKKAKLSNKKLHSKSKNKIVKFPFKDIKKKEKLKL